jgi:hypothetical protein
VRKFGSNTEGRANVAAVLAMIKECPEAVTNPDADTSLAALGVECCAHPGAMLAVLDAEPTLKLTKPKQQGKPKQCW